MLTDAERQELKTALETERLRLEKSLEEVGRRDPKDAANWDPKFPHMGEGHNASSTMLEESADEVEELDLRLETEQTLEDRLHGVQHALKKIGTPQYGLCEQCGKPISLERLRANPAARFDIEHNKG